MSAEGSPASQESETPQDSLEEDLLGASSSNEIQSAAQKKVYLESINSKKLLFLMSVGLTDQGCSIFYLDRDPWNTLKKRDIKPSRSEYAQEVCRRCILLNIQPIPKTANWGSRKCIEWLTTNPLTDEQDVLFLKNEVQKIEVLINQAQQEG
jgi:hypothetical protein